MFLKDPIFKISRNYTTDLQDLSVRVFSIFFDCVVLGVVRCVTLGCSDVLADIVLSPCLWTEFQTVKPGLGRAPNGQMLPSASLPEFGMLCPMFANWGPNGGEWKESFIRCSVMFWLFMWKMCLNNRFKSSGGLF